MTEAAAKTTPSSRKPPRRKETPTNGIVEVLAGAGFATARHKIAIGRISGAFDVYRALFPLPTKLRKELERKSRSELKRIIGDTKKLARRIKHSSLQTRFRLEILYGWPSLTGLIDRAKFGESLNGTPGMPGRPGNEVLNNLLVDLSVVWASGVPARPGITRRGSASDYGVEMYSGPLLDFVRQLLDIEGIPYPSRDGLGGRLYDVTRRYGIA